MNDLTPFENQPSEEKKNDVLNLIIETKKRLENIVDTLSPLFSKAQVLKGFYMFSACAY